MHVLIIPSEEFIPANNHLAGIFQKHQALALQKIGCRVGIISIRQSLSGPMLCKAIFFRVLGIHLNNELRNMTIRKLVELFFDKVFRLDRFVSKENVNGLDVLRIDGFYFLPPSKHSNHIGWLIAGKRVWKKYCEEYGTPDIIHAHNAVYAGLLANTIRKKSGIPYMITEHSSFIARNLESGIISNKIKRTYTQASGFFVVSNFLGQKIDKLFQTKLHWKEIPNVLDPEIEAAPMPKEILPEQPFLFISIGSLIPLKRHRDLITAFYQQFSGDFQVKLIIAGDGELKAELQQLINQLQLSSQVQLSDRMSRQQILQLIDMGHCLVHCSEIETFGVVLIEALSRGKPVISTRCGGPESIVNDLNGVLYSVGDTVALAAAMLQIMKQYKNFQQDQIRKEALQQYGHLSFGQRLIKEYEKVIL